MYRGYRGIFFALVGWLALAPLAAVHSREPKAAIERKEAQTQDKISNAAAAVASAIRDTNKSAKDDPGCQDRKDRRDSDLCAQWKAADAAHRAAEWAKWSAFIGMAGAALLLWTLWDTRVTSRRQLRAYVMIETHELVTLEAGKPLAGVVNFKNAGQTPALEVCASIRLFAAQQPHPPEVQTLLPAGSTGPLAPGADAHSHVATDRATSKNEVDDIIAGKADVIMFGKITYKDIFKAAHATAFKVRLIVRIDGTTVFAVCNEGNYAD